MTRNSLYEHLKLNRLLQGKRHTSVQGCPGIVDLANRRAGLQLKRPRGHPDVLLCGYSTVGLLGLSGLRQGVMRTSSSLGSGTESHGGVPKPGGGWARGAAGGKHMGSWAVGRAGPALEGWAGSVRPVDASMALIYLLVAVLFNFI